MNAVVIRILRKVAAIALLAAIPAVLWIGLFLPLTETYKANVKVLADKAALYARYRAIASQSMLLETPANAPIPAEPETLSGDGEAVMQASLQSMLQTVIATSGASFLSAQAIPARTSEGIDYLGVQLVITAELARVRDLLDALERHRPYLFVERLDLRRQGYAPEDEAYQPVVLDVTMEVVAARPIASEDSGTAQ